MKFVVDNWILISIALVSGSSLLWTVFQGATVRGLSPAAAVHLINREKAVVVDLRDAAAFAEGHVVGSRNIPLAGLQEKLAGAVKNKGLPLILVCQTGKQAAGAVAVAKKLGFDNAQPLAGGLIAWTSANMPLEKAGA